MQSQHQVVPLAVKGFALLERTHKGRLAVVAELFETSALAHRIANAMGVASFRQACVAIGARVRADGPLRVPQLVGDRVTVFGKLATSKSDEQWLLLLLVEDRRLFKNFAGSIPSDIMEGVAMHSIYGSNHALSSSKLKILDLVLARAELLREGGSEQDQGREERLKEHRQRVKDLLARQEVIKGVPSVGGQPRAAAESKRESVPLRTIPAERGRIQRFSQHDEHRFLAEHSWRIAGASVWQTQRGGPPKLRVELFKSRAFAVQLTENTRASSFRQFCHDTVAHYLRTGQVNIQSRKDWTYRVYLRTIPRSLGPELVCLIVFDACDAPRRVTIVESLQRLSPSHFIALIASAFAQHSDHRMSKKLSNVRSALRLLDELDDGLEASGSPFVRKVKERVDHLLAVAQERKRIRARRGYSPPPPVLSETASARKANPVDSDSVAYSNASLSRCTEAAVSPRATPSLVSDSPAALAQAQLMQYLMQSNQNLSSQNEHLMERIEKLTSQLETFKSMYGNVSRVHRG